MKPVTDPVFTAAVAAIDAGDVPALDALIAQHPDLVADRFGNGQEGYFADPYLFWFVAENPIRNDRLPQNIVGVAQALAAHVRRLSPQTLQHQLDYALGLVATGRVPRESGVQLDLIDALVAEGARPGDLGGVLGHNELAAAERLLEHGAPLSLAAAVALKRWSNATSLAATASAVEKTDALVVAAYRADAIGVDFLLANGADPNARSARIHRHSAPLHQAALSGSLQAVEALVRAGADLKATDSMWDGTPLGWAQHGKHAEIESFLRAAG